MQTHPTPTSQPLLLNALSSVHHLNFASASTSFSPLSLFASLLLLSKCSNDQSIQELTTSLYFDPAQFHKAIQTVSNDKTLSLAFNIFDRHLERVSPQFQEQMKREFGFVPEILQSVKQVNDWCSLHTNGRISQIVQNIDFGTLLISAIYFKANWMHQFDKGQTKEENFTTFSGVTTMQMMKTRFKMNYAETGAAQIVDLYYQNSSLTARIILPKGNSQSEFINALSKESIIARTNSQDVILHLPRIKIESTFELNGFLQSLGIKMIFQGVNCEETLGKRIAIEQIFQKTFLLVDEEGTEAAAVTAIRAKMGCAVPHLPIQVICNRPFWFLLMGPGGEVVFVASKIE